MLEYNEIKERKIIEFNDEPCEVMESHVARTQQRKPQNQVKLRSLLSGKTFNATFHVSDKVNEADITKKDIKFLYQNRDEYYFTDPNDPKNRFKVDTVLIGDAVKFLKENLIVIAMVWGEEEKEKIIKIILPIKMEFKIKSAPPAVKGNTAQGGTKQVILENGTTINTPLFINEDDIIRVNTETGEYVERV